MTLNHERSEELVDKIVLVHYYEIQGKKKKLNCAWCEEVACEKLRKARYVSK